MLNSLVAEKLISEYAIGGATALLFYSTPTFTEDIDIFITLVQQEPGGIISLEPIFSFLKKHYNAEVSGEYILLFGFPLQFLPAYNELSSQALREANTVEIEGEKTQILALEYLMAMMIDLGKAKYRERLRMLLEEKKFDELRLHAILTEHGLGAKWQQFLNQQ